MDNYSFSNDIQAFKDYSNISWSEMALELGVPRSTISNWVQGKTQPNRSSLETVYGYIFRKGYHLNKLKEQMFKDSCPAGSIILFHGAKNSIQGQPSFSFSNEKNDFGHGFYLGENLFQSASFVSGYPSSSVYIAHLKLDDTLRTIEYHVDTDWMLTIAYCRGKLKEYEKSTYLKEILSRLNGADVIKAPIADNRMFRILDEFIEGNITDLQCRSALSATDLGMQYVIVSDKGLKNLQIIHRCYLCVEEKTYYTREKKAADSISTQKVKFVKREYAGKGKYIDEMLI